MEPITKSLKKRKLKQGEKEDQSFALIKKKGMQCSGACFTQL
jgi:hypothetical protein